MRIVEERGRVRVGELAARFHVSAVTIRKDLLALEADGRLVRTHGGAIAIDRSRPELAFDIRERLQPAEKLGSARPRLRSSTMARASSWTPARRPCRSPGTSRPAAAGAS